METIEVNALGKPMQATLPSSLATCLELSLQWGTSIEDTPSLLRLCSATIGICLDKHAILPAYKPHKHKILEYGYLILERLLEKNVDATKVFQDGTKLLTAISKKIPLQNEVQDTKDFLASEEEDS